LPIWLLSYRTGAGQLAGQQIHCHSEPRKAALARRERCEELQFPGVSPKLQNPRFTRNDKDGFFVESSDTDFDVWLRGRLAHALEGVRQEVQQVGRDQ